MKTLLVSNIPSPYREPVYEAVAKHIQEFLVIYCQEIESDRQWKFTLGNYQRHFLKGRTFSYERIYSHHVHWNPTIWKVLNEIDPDIIITNGYNPSHILAFLWSQIKGRKHIAMTDGWLKSEEHLTILHRLVRKIILKRSSAYIGASQRSIELFINYGANPESCFQSHLCSNISAFKSICNDINERPYDVMFSGQFIDRKMPDFFVEVSKYISMHRANIKCLLIGDGPLRPQTLASLDDAKISYSYPGFVSQDELPSYYSQAKIFLFPTRQECWGVVANEACSAGTPVITCDNTAIDGELIKNDINGYILPLEVNLWGEKIISLLDDSQKLTTLSENSKISAEPYNYVAAATGITDAINHTKGQAKR